MNARRLCPRIATAIPIAIGVEKASSPAMWLGLSSGPMNRGG